MENSFFCEATANTHVEQNKPDGNDNDKQLWKLGHLSLKPKKKKKKDLCRTFASVVCY